MRCSKEGYRGLRVDRLRGAEGHSLGVTGDHELSEATGRLRGRPGGCRPGPPRESERHGERGLHPGLGVQSLQGPQGEGATAVLP